MTLGHITTHPCPLFATRHAPSIIKKHNFQYTCRIMLYVSYKLHLTKTYHKAIVDLQQISNATMSVYQNPFKWVWGAPFNQIKLIPCMKATMHATDTRLNLPCLWGNSSTNLVFLVCELGVWFCSRFKTTLFLRVHCSDEVQDAFKTPSVFERMIRILRYNKILEIGHVQVGAGRGSLIN